MCSGRGGVDGRAGGTAGDEAMGSEAEGKDNQVVVAEVGLAEEGDWAWGE